MMHFRWRWRLRGAHVVVALFIGPSELATHAHAGVLTLGPEEWAQLRDDLTFSSVAVHEIVEDT